MPTDVDPGSLARLLDLQEQDSAMDRLIHRRDTLPEAQRLAEVTDTIAELDSDIEIAGKQRDEIAREQDRLEGEIGLLSDKIAREEQRLFSGGVSNPKELGALQAEVESLKRRRSGIEDGLLEIMEQREQAEATLANLKTERNTADAEAQGLRSVVDEITTEIEQELVTHRAAREELVPTIPESLLALYEQLRAAKGGIGAARLEGATCSGCHTKLPAVEVERLRASGGVQRCDNCRRILVV